MQQINNKDLLQAENQKLRNEIAIILKNSRTMPQNHVDLNKRQLLQNIHLLKAKLQFTSSSCDISSQIAKKQSQIKHLNQAIFQLQEQKKELKFNHVKTEMDETVQDQLNTKNRAIRMKGAEINMLDNQISKVKTSIIKKNKQFASLQKNNQVQKAKLIKMKESTKKHLPITQRQLSTLQIQQEQLDQTHQQHSTTIKSRIREIKFKLNHNQPRKEQLSKLFKLKQNELAQNQIRIRTLRKEIKLQLRAHLQNEEFQDQATFSDYPASAQSYDWPALSQPVPQKQSKLEQ